MTTEPSIDLEFKILQAIDTATHRMLHRDVLVEVAKHVMAVVVTDRLNPPGTAFGENVIAVGINDYVMAPIKSPKDCVDRRFKIARIDTKLVSAKDCSNLFNVIHHLENCFK